MRSVLIWLLLMTPAWAGEIIVCDPLHPAVPQMVIWHLPTANTPDYQGQPNTLINPTLSVTLPLPFWRCDQPNNQVVDFTVQEQADYAAWLQQQQDAQTCAQIQVLDVDASQLMPVIASVVAAQTALPILLSPEAIQQGLAAQAGVVCP